MKEDQIFKLIAAGIGAFIVKEMIKAPTPTPVGFPIGMVFGNEITYGQLFDTMKNFQFKDVKITKDNTKEVNSE